MKDTGVAERSTRSLLITGAFWIAAARIVSMLTGVASMAVLARLLLPDDFGLIAIASAIAVILTTVSELSLSQALIQIEDLEDSHYDTAFTLNFIRSIIVGAIVAGAALPAASFYDDQRLVEVLLIFAVACVLGSLSSPRIVIYQRNLDFRANVILEVAEKIVGFLVAATIAYFFRTYFALVLGVVASQATRSLLSFLVAPYRPRLTLSRQRELMDFSIWLTLGTWIQTLNWRSDPLLFGYFVPTSRLGQFSMAQRLASMSTQEFLAPIAQMLFPTFSRIRNNPHRLRAAYLSAQGVLTFIVVPIAVGLAIVAEPFVRIFIGEKWLDAVPMLQMLVLASGIQRCQSVHPIAMATGNTKSLFHRDLRALVVRLPLIVLGMIVGANFGIGILIGAVTGNLLAATINAWLNVRLIAKFSTISMADHLAVLARPVLAVLIMTLIVEATGMLLQTGEGFRQDLLLVTTMVVTGAIAYLVTAFGIWLVAGKPEGPETFLLDLMARLLSRSRKLISPGSD